MKRALRHMKNEAAFGYEAHPEGCMKCEGTLCFMMNAVHRFVFALANASYEQSECFI